MGWLRPGDAAAEMRGGGVSSAALGDDLGGIEDEAEGGEAPVDAGAGAGPESATDEPVGGAAAAPATDQTV